MKSRVKKENPVKRFTMYLALLIKYEKLKKSFKKLEQAHLESVENEKYLMQELSIYKTQLRATNKELVLLKQKKGK